MSLQWNFFFAPTSSIIVGFELIQLGFIRNTILLSDEPRLVKKYDEKINIVLIKWFSAFSLYKKEKWVKTKTTLK